MTKTLELTTEELEDLQFFMLMAYTDTDYDGTTLKATAGELLTRLEGLTK